MDRHQSQALIRNDAWLKHPAIIHGTASGLWLTLPLILDQGHDWHLLVVSKDEQKMSITQQIYTGIKGCALIQ
ncbi:hypothetical protein GQ43DRAFT_495305 [Delitschia confertaspora ATCC 74209]|uniref:Uncharacterized protein n=1 Tax=Delitschia confertaspora ATCC 74209 TaxID=1513339 RepID=A0A9P4JJH8_9PLEO|nr:hypothetical protein GQ43DRAFT_495305 [Delitschia confertaspora ATCC 74209]